MNKKIKITETVLRDAHQSLLATRMTTEQMLPILKAIDQVGYHAIEMWGGATFDACLRYLDEDPWERLRTIRKHVKNTKLQMLLRGQNLLGYHNYPDDIVTAFIERSVANGIDIIRVFDGLNDPRNLELAIKIAKREGAHAQAAIAYTVSPVHTVEKFVELAKTYANLGADSLCIKDMSGILTPQTGVQLVRGIKAVVDLPLEIHSHETSGLASMLYLKAIEAGADIIDTAISPLASGTSQPPTEAFVASLAEMPFSTGIDLKQLSVVADHFRELRDSYLANGQINPKMLSVDINALVYQVPGGMLSNLVAQLKAQNALDRYEEVLAEVPKVRADLGFPPLVTPMSQMVGTQAVLNVILGERYKMIPSEVKEYARGNYGKTSVPIAQEMLQRIIGDEQPIDYRPADAMAPQYETVKREIAEYMESEEDVLSYALFPPVALEFFKRRNAALYKIDEQCEGIADQAHYI